MNITHRKINKIFIRGGWIGLELGWQVVFVQFFGVGGGGWEWTGSEGGGRRRASWDGGDW